MLTEGCVLFFSQKTLLNTLQLVFALHPWPSGGDTAAGAEGEQPHGTHGGFSRRPGDREQSTSHLLPVETETGA